MSLDLSAFGLTEEDVKDAPVHEIPDEQEFDNSLTALWKVQILYRTGVQAGSDLKQDNVDYVFYRERQSGDREYYFADPDLCKSVHAEYGGIAVGGYNFGIQNVFTMIPDLNNVVGWRAEKTPHEVFEFGADRITVIKAWQSKRNAHQFQLFTLPSFIQSIALANGMIDNKFVDYNALANEPTNSIVEQSMELIGVCVDENNEVQSADNGIDDSVLAIARKNLWDHLGAAPGGWKKNKSSHKMIPDGSNIQAILRVIAMSTESPLNIWASVTQVSDPMGPKEGNEEGKRNYGIPVVTKIYKSKEEAEKEKGSTVVFSGLKVPEMYAESGMSVDEFKAVLEESVSVVFGKKSLKTAMKALDDNEEEILTDTGLTVDQIKPWVENKFK